MRALAFVVLLAVACVSPSRAQVALTPERTFGCERVVHAIVDFQRATLVLRPDRSFELHHTHTSPARGWSTWLEGSFVWTPTELVLRPGAALRRAWEGDMHRQDHGEDVGAFQWREPVSTAAWHLRRTTRGHRECFVVAELGTEVCGGSPAVECAAGPPPVRRRPDSAPHSR